MNRADLQRLAKSRILDAKALLAAHRWAGAYYMAGYAVECGLKSCIIARLMQTDEFLERKFSEQCWTHNLVQLLSLAGMNTILNTAEPNVLSNWNIAKDWSESSRYSRATKTQAQELYEAIIDNKHGVFSWIKRHW